METDSNLVVLRPQWGNVMKLLWKIEIIILLLLLNCRNLGTLIQLLAWKLVHDWHTLEGCATPGSGKALIGGESSQWDCDLQRGQVEAWKLIVN